MFKRQYVRYLKKTKRGADLSEMHNVLEKFQKIRNAFDVHSKKQFDGQPRDAAVSQSCIILSAPGFLELLMQANREYLLQFNISEEIAKYLHIEV